MTEESEKLINNFLQKDVVFFINKEKPIKTGKLLIFKFKDFYFNFILKNNNVNKIFEIPYPFNITKGVNSLIFSWIDRLESFAITNALYLLSIKFRYTSSV